MRVLRESITIATSFLITRDVDTHYSVSDTAHFQFQFELDDFHIEKSRLTAHKCWLAGARNGG